MLRKDKKSQGASSTRRGRGFHSSTGRIVTPEAGRASSEERKRGNVRITEEEGEEEEEGVKKHADEHMRLLKLDRGRLAMLA